MQGPDCNRQIRPREIDIISGLCDLQCWYGTGEEPVSETAGVLIIAHHVDAGNAFGSVYPNFSAPLYMSAGLGLRYYTAIGPIRLDVAFPFQRVPGSGPVAVYVSIGQAF